MRKRNIAVERRRRRENVDIRLIPAEEIVAYLRRGNNAITRARMCDSSFQIKCRYRP